MLKRAQPKKKDEAEKNPSLKLGNVRKADSSLIWWTVGSIILLTLIFWGDISAIFSSENNDKPTAKIGKDYSYSCIGSNGFSYTRPKNAFCDGSKTPQGRSCESGYTAIKGGGDVGWYCRCSSGFSCSSHHQTKLKPMEDQYDNIGRYINTAQVNLYNQSSVNYYNSQIDKYNELASRINKYMSENCECR